MDIDRRLGFVGALVVGNVVVTVRTVCACFLRGEGYMGSGLLLFLRSFG